LIAALHLPKNDDVKRFEDAFADLMGQKFALAFPYGRTGLMLLLKALEIEDQEIICPAYTCVVVPHAIVYSGNVPVFIDCEPEGFNMDLDLAGEAITDKTRALLATSIFGYPVNLDKLDKIRKMHPQIYIIQDCAHSFAAKWRGRPVQKEGTAALFGLNISKLLTSIFGGMITTDDYAVFNKLKQLRDNELNPPSWIKSIRRLFYFLAVYLAFSKGFYGVINRFERHGFLNPFVKYYDELHIDMPDDYLEAMTNVEARVGIANIKRYNNIIKNRIAAAEQYSQCLQDVVDLELPPEASGATYSHFVVQVKDRNKWLNEGLNRGVQFGSLIEYNIPEMPAYGNHKPEDFPIANQYSRTALNLPLWGGKRLAENIINCIFNN
jgi:dTDP-4-amino-4,6-dideoxygalactose transaminase